MKKNVIIVLFLFQLSEITAQDISFGGIAYYQFSFKSIRTEYLILYNGDIDKSKTFSTEKQFSNLNSFGVDFRILFEKKYLTGLIITYGEKITSQYNDGNRYFNQSINLLSVELPIFYHINFNEIIFVEAGLQFSFLNGKYTEEFNMFNPQTSILEENKDSYTSSTIAFKPAINLGSKYVNRLEFFITITYALNSELNFDDLRWDNVESIKYNFNGFCIGIIANYSF
jgi:hypothetical protein